LRETYFRFFEERKRERERRQEGGSKALVTPFTSALKSYIVLISLCLIARDFDYPLRAYRSA
jgi:hypothetical protein